jgi:putative tricarboxylic transport membrane protein
LWVGGGLIANLILIDEAGFIIASTIMFAMVARGFGSRNWPRDLGLGFAIALVAYVGFDRLLGYKIGSGLIEALI